MKRKVKFWGVKGFSVIYNIFGFLGIKAYCYGFSSITQANSLVIDQKDGTQVIVVIITVLFFLSSYLLINSKKSGYLIPVFLLTFLITGGFLILLPLLVIHVFFFTNFKDPEKNNFSTVC